MMTNLDVALSTTRGITGEIEPATLDISKYRDGDSLPAGRVVGTPQRRRHGKAFFVVSTPWAVTENVASLVGDAPLHENDRCASQCSSKVTPSVAAQPQTPTTTFLPWGSDPNVGDNGFEDRSYRTTQRSHFTAYWTEEEARSAVGIVKMSGPPRRQRQRSEPAGNDRGSLHPSARTPRAAEDTLNASTINSGIYSFPNQNKIDHVKELLQPPAYAETPRCMSRQSHDPEERNIAVKSPENVSHIDVHTWNQPSSACRVNRVTDHGWRRVRKSSRPPKQPASAALPGMDVRESVLEHIDRRNEQQRTKTILDAQVAHNQRKQKAREAEERRFKEDMDTEVTCWKKQEDELATSVRADERLNRVQPDSLFYAREQRIQEEQALKKKKVATSLSIGPTPLEEYCSDQLHRAKEVVFRREALSEYRHIREAAAQDVVAQDAIAAEMRATEIERRHASRKADRESLLDRQLSSAQASAKKSQSREVAGQATTRSEHKARIEARLAELLEVNSENLRKHLDANATNSALMEAQQTAQLAEKREGQRMRARAEHEAIEDSKCRRADFAAERAKNVKHKREVLAQITERTRQCRSATPSSARPARKI